MEEEQQKIGEKDCIKVPRNMAKSIHGKHKNYEGYDAKKC